LIVAEERLLINGIKIDIFEEPPPPKKFSACRGCSNQFGFSGRFGDASLQCGFPVDGAAEEEEDIAL